MSSKILLRRGTAAQWSSANPILGNGELGIETDTLKIKIGNGTSTWSQLTSYANVTPSQLTSEINNLINAAPATLDTLNELAAAINNDASFSTTVNNLLTGKVSKSGGDTITSSTSSTIGLVIKGATSQSANLQEWQDSSGTVIAKIDANGKLRSDELQGIYNRIGIYQPTILPPSSTNVALIVKGQTSQSANLQEWQNSGGTVIAGIDAYGNAGFGGFAPSSSYGLRVKTNNNPAVTGLLVQGATSQTANLQEWQDYAGTVLGSVSSNGKLYIYENTAGSNGTALDINQGSGSRRMVFGLNGLNVNSTLTVGNISWSGSAQLESYSGSANRIGLFVRGAASQTASLQEWQDSTGTSQLSVSSTADLISTGSHSVRFAYHQNVGGTGSYIDFGQTANTLSINQRVTTAVALIVKGASSQTANLTEWQNNAGTSLAQVRSSGDIFTATKFGTISGTPNIFGVVYGDGTVPSIYAEGSFPTNSGFASPAVFPNEEGWYPYFAYKVPDIVETSDDGTTWTNRAPMDYAGLFAYQPNYTITTSNRYLRITMNQPTYTFLGLAVARFYYGTNYRSHTMKTELLNSSGGVIATYGPTAGTNVYDGAILAQKFNSYNGTTAATRITIENTQFVSGDSFTLASLMTYLSKPGTGKSFQTKFPMSWNSYKTTIFQPTQPGAQALIVKGKDQSVSISNAVGNGTTVTFTTTTNNEFVAGNTVNISGINPSSYNLGVVTIAAVPTGNTFTVTNSATGTYVSGGAAAINMGANIQEWQNNSGTVLSKITFDGSGYFPGLTLTNQYGTLTSPGWSAFGNASPIGGSTGVTVYIAPYNATNTGLIVRGYTSQSANLQEWQSSSGVVKVAINSDGAIRFDDQTHSPTIKWGNATVWEAVGGTASMRINPYGPGYIGLIVKGFSGQTANLQQWQNSSGTVLSNVRSDGTVAAPYFDNPEASGAYAQFNAGGSIDVISRVTAQPTFRVRGSVSQTADLQQWQNSAGTILASISSTGKLTITNTSASASLIEVLGSGSGTFVVSQTGGIITNGGLSSIGGGSYFGGYGGSGDVVVTVTGASGQTGDLQRWTNFAGTVLAKMTSAGALDVTGITVNGAAITTPLATPTVAGTIYGFTETTINDHNYNNNAYGLNSLSNTTYGGSTTDNSAFGSSSLRSLTTGTNNSAFGSQALKSATAAANNSAFGYGALYSTTGSGNIGIGVESLYSNINGMGNLAVGNSALWNSTQNYNTGLGPRSLYTLATGSENIAIGHSALEYLSSASNNISIGGYSGWNLTTGSNNIVVGYSASASSATVSNEITLGDSNITKFRVPGLSIDWDKDIEIMSIMGAY